MTPAMDAVYILVVVTLLAPGAERTTMTPVESGPVCAALAARQAVRPDVAAYCQPVSAATWRRIRRSASRPPAGVAR
jgi:hypothetical protein